MKITPPKHLSPDGRRLFSALQRDYHIADPAGVKILTTLCEASDRTRSCREVIEAEGVTIRDKWNQTKPHPLLAAERDSRAQILQAFKVLGLDVPMEGGKNE
jgi:P27 family predicted phage terminase small subunit